MPGEVQLLVPCPERVTVALKLLDLLGGKVDVVPLECGSQGVCGGVVQRKTQSDNELRGEAKP
jgi:hypothetical protein